MKKIPEQKLQAFSAGAMGTRSYSKKELEELRKKEEEEAAAHVFKEFVETFQEAPSTTSKVWVKAGTYDAGARKEDTSERGKLYKPVSRLEERRGGGGHGGGHGGGGGGGGGGEPRVDHSRSKHSSSKLSKDKKKSNLELFKEELRQMQEERSERHKYKNVLRGVIGPGGVDPAGDASAELGSYDTGDPNTTNLYLGNLNPKITEQQLMEIFGRYGPLASIKIMWPRSEEEKARGRNCGFVAFMSRKDGERALRCINGTEVMSYEMKLGWGKAVVIPPVPIYIPPALQHPSRPPPPSGLPFNAQPPKHLANKIPRVRPGECYPSDPEDRQLYEQILMQSIVKVVVPTERNVLMLIHRMVEFVIREGPMFEAIIMNKELNNPYFSFLYENQSPHHIYYRWRLFSILQGDTPKQWAANDFRMFKGGSVWRPPLLNLYTAGMPDDLVQEHDQQALRGSLSNNQRVRLEELIRHLTPERARVGEAMAWCLEHAEAAGEIAACLGEALCGPDTAPQRRVARLYLASDLLHNAQAKLAHASAFRGALERRLPAALRACRRAGDALAARSRLQAEAYRARVARVLAAWSDWAVYPQDYLARLAADFRARSASPPSSPSAAPGSPSAAPGSPASPASPPTPPRPASRASSASGEWDGALDGAALRRLAATRLPDIDGVPVDEDIDGVPLERPSPSPPRSPAAPAPAPATLPAPAFVPSRWESVEPATVDAGAVTTDLWPPHAAPPSPAASTATAAAATSVDTPHSGAEGAVGAAVEAGEVPRATLRSVEVRVLQYADELEAGARSLRPGLSPAQQVQHYRRKLLKRAARLHAAAPADTDHDDISTTSSKKSKKYREVSLSPPPKRSRHRSRSRSRERSVSVRSRERGERGERGERERRRRSPDTPPSPPPPPAPHTPHTPHRKHKHAKHKY